MKSPELVDKRLAEFVGIMLGDGSVGEYECSDGSGNIKIQRVVKVTISKDEQDYADHISDLYQDLFGIEPRRHEKDDENTLDIRCFRKDLFEFMTEEVGLKTAPKKGRAVIPEKYISNDLSNHMLRGLFDTDGSLVLTDNNGTLYPRLEIKISECPMQDQVTELLEEKGFRFGSYDCGNGKIRIQMNGKGQLQKWQEEIGFNNQRHLSKLERI
ncbi:MAG: LAGLIDADG family homing endonuclease [Candidatus Nanohaloarchaea archaeon]